MSTRSGNDETTWGNCEMGVARIGRSNHESICIWRPSARLTSTVPADCEIVLRRKTFGDGSRFYVPYPNFDSFVLQAQMAGLAILSRQRALSADRQNSLRTASFLYQRARRTSDYIRRHFGSRR